MFVLYEKVEKQSYTMSLKTMKLVAKDVDVTRHYVTQSIWIAQANSTFDFFSPLKVETHKASLGYISYIYIYIFQDEIWQTCFVQWTFFFFFYKPDLFEGRKKIILSLFYSTKPWFTKTSIQNNCTDQLANRNNINLIYPLTS